MSDTEANVEKGAAGRLGPVVVAGLIIIAVLAFVLQNTQTVDFRFLFFGFSTPLWLVIVVCAAGGFVAGWLLAWSGSRRRRRR